MKSQKKQKNKLVFVSSYLDMDLPGTIVDREKLKVFKTYNIVDILANRIPKANQKIYFDAVKGFLQIPNNNLTLKISIMISSADLYKLLLPREIVGRIYRGEKILKEFKFDSNNNIYRSIALWPEILNFPLFYQDTKIASEKTIYKWSSQKNWKDFFLSSIENK